MIMKQSLGLFCVLSATILMSACSKDKVIPQGKRVAILEQAAAVKSEVANGASQINLGEAVVNPYWRQVVQARIFDFRTAVERRSYLYIRCRWFFARL